MLIGNLQSRGVNGTETEVFGATAVAIAYFMRYTSCRAWLHALTRLSVRRCSHVNSDLPAVGLKLTLPLGNSHLGFRRAGAIGRCVCCDTPIGRKVIIRHKRETDIVSTDNEPSDNCDAVIQARHSITWPPVYGTRWPTTCVINRSRQSINKYHLFLA